MPDIAATAEAALERLRRIMGRWPRPSAGQGVRADAVLAGMQPLVPLAEMVLRLPLGYAKGYYQGAGYLSGSPRVVLTDHALARAVLQDVAIALPEMGDAPLDRTQYGQVKEHAYKLLGLATDLDVTQGQLAKVGGAASAAWDPWVSLSPIVDMGATDPLAQKAEAAVQRVSKFVNSFPARGATAAAALRALTPLRPLAVNIASLSVGTKKGTIAGPGVVDTILRTYSPLFAVVESVEGRAQPATGYLSGSSTITDADLTVAKFILNALDNQLPAMGDAPLDAGGLYGQLKTAAHRLLFIATDLDIDTSAADEVARLWTSTKEAARDVAMAVAHAADVGFSVGKTALVIGLVGAGILAVTQLVRRRPREER